MSVSDSREHLAARVLVLSVPQAMLRLDSVLPYLNQVDEVASHAVNKMAVCQGK
jgi:hypothetical protein